MNVHTVSDHENAMAELIKQERAIRRKRVEKLMKKELPNGDGISKDEKTV